VATGGRDGAVRVWDTRQHDAPVAAFLPKAASKVGSPEASLLRGDGTQLCSCSRWGPPFPDA
jgi:hypothetical protein